MDASLPLEYLYGLALTTFTFWILSLTPEDYLPFRFFFR